MFWTGRYYGRLRSYRAEQQADHCSQPLKRLHKILTHFVQGQSVLSPFLGEQLQHMVPESLKTRKNKVTYW